MFGPNVPKFADRHLRARGIKYPQIRILGTPFQLEVWEALLRIPSSKLVSYEGLAMAIGKPGGARAVAGAVARNPVSWLIPCHRVIRQTGVISGYRWGPLRKRAILAWEASLANGKISVV